VAKDKVSDARDDTFTVGTGDEKDGGGVHETRIRLRH
jgi:hypothetical protein